MILEANSVMENPTQQLKRRMDKWIDYFDARICLLAKGTMLFIVGLVLFTAVLSLVAMMQRVKIDGLTSRIEALEKRSK